MRGHSLTEERVQRLGFRGEGGTREGTSGEDRRSVGEVGMRQEGRVGRRKHLREVRRGREMLWCVLLHVESLSGVLRRMHLQIHTCPGVRVRTMRPQVRVCPGVQQSSSCLSL